MSDCSCKKCKGACQNKPGWFLPDEIEKLAKNKNITTKELFDSFLAVDWWEGDEITDYETVFVLSPATLSTGSGVMFGDDPRGVCALFKAGKCTIHYEGKPKECAAYIHSTEHEESKKTRHKIVKAWNTPENQQMIRDLLGREPEEPEKESFGSFLDFVSDF